MCTSIAYIGSMRVWLNKKAKSARTNAPREGEQSTGEPDPKRQVLISACPEDEGRVREDTGSDHAVDHEAGDVEAG